jgi:hypothetical protein
MVKQWTRRQVLAQVGITAAAIHTLVGDQLAPKYEAGMSKYPLGQYRDRVGLNIEMVHKKVVKKG